MIRFFNILLLLFVASGAKVTVPSGTIVSFRLVSPASSQDGSGKAIEGIVTVPVNVNGVTVIAPGTKLTGKTADVKKAANDNEAATLRFNFTRVIPPSGSSADLHAQLSAIDNIRESVGTDGLVTGIVASQTWYGMLDQGIGKLGNNHAALADMIGKVRDGFLKQGVDATISYPAGTDMQLKLTQDLSLMPPGNPPIVPAIQNVQELTQVADSQPNRTSAGDPPKSSDLTNLMFIGSSEEVQAAFKAAGWTVAAERDDKAVMETARAIIENRGYAEAPVSTLTLDNKPPDFVFQKQTNTFYMRHHMRVYKRPVQFEGQDVWVAAATHDTGVAFSKESRTITHKIDSNIDNERAKVVNDLAFSGYVEAFALVPRTGIPPDLSNATGDVLKTDGKMAALQFRTKPQNPAAITLN